MGGILSGFAGMWDAGDYSFKESAASGSSRKRHSVLLPARELFRFHGLRCPFRKHFNGSDVSGRDFGCPHESWIEVGHFDGIKAAKLFFSFRKWTVGVEEDFSISHLHAGCSRHLWEIGLRRRAPK